jgi:hypothetical protein
MKYEYIYILSITLYQNISIVQSIRGKDQLLLDGYRYLRDRYDRNIYKTYQDHIFLST